MPKKKYLVFAYSSSVELTNGVKPIVNQSSVLGTAILNIVQNIIKLRSSTGVCL